MLGVDLWPLYLVTALSALVGLVLLLVPLRGTWRWLRTRGGPDPEKRAARPGLSACAAELLGGITLISVAVAGVSLMTAIASYRALSERTKCAEVLAWPIKNQPQRIYLEYYPVVDGLKQPKETYFVNGDQWRMEGHILRWSKPLRLLGLKTCYRLTRLDGRFYSVEPPPGKRLRAYPLGGESGERDWLWTYLRKNEYRLPGVEGVGGKGVYREPKKGVVFEVWVTPDGWDIAERR